MNNHQNIGMSEIREAVESIKTVILQGQYEASKDVNRIQLTIYSTSADLPENRRKALPDVDDLKKILE